MHKLYFILIKREKADSKDIVNDVVFELENEWFCWKGYFSNAKSDWFVVWWKWSGILFDKWECFFEQLKQEEILYSVGEHKKNSDEIQNVWEQIWGEWENPLTRDPHKEYWYSDDCRLVWNNLNRLKELQEKSAGSNVEVFDLGEYKEYCFWDIDFKNHKDKHIIVLDCHY